MSSYVLGGWTQSVSAQPPEGFSYTMYGMITNLTGLTSGTPQEPGWSPAKTPKPDVPGSVLWTYGGGGCTPDAMPADKDEIQAIVAATGSQGWDGVDFDDECSMNIKNLIATMTALKPKQRSYTFLAGWDYNNPQSSSTGAAANRAVTAIAEVGVADRFVLMCYAAAMWSMSDIKANVGPAIDRTIDNGVPPKQVILALTTAGLDPENLGYFLDQVITKEIGGLFVWNFTALQADDLKTICEQLGITTEASKNPKAGSGAKSQ